MLRIAFAVSLFLLLLAAPACEQAESVNPDLLPGGGNDVVWLYCASGYRASVAAGFVERAGRRPVVVVDNFDTNGRPLAARMLTRTG